MASTTNDKNRIAEMLRNSAHAAQSGLVAGRGFVGDDIELVHRDELAENDVPFIITKTVTVPTKNGNEALIIYGVNAKDFSEFKFFAGAYITNQFSEDNDAHISQDDLDNFAWHCVKHPEIETKYFTRDAKGKRSPVVPVLLEYYLAPSLRAKVNGNTAAANRARVKAMSNVDMPEDFDDDYTDDTDDTVTAPKSRKTTVKVPSKAVTEKATAKAPKPSEKALSASSGSLTVIPGPNQRGRGRPPTGAAYWDGRRGVYLDVNRKPINR